MNIIRATKSENFLWEQQIAIAVDHVTSTEAQLSEVCEAFGNYARKAAKLRNASDDLANALHKLSTSDSIKESKSLKKCLQLLSDSVASVGDLRDQHVKSVSSNTVKKLTQFGPVCKKTKNEIKNLEKLAGPTSKTKTKSGVSTDSSNILETENISRDIEEIVCNFEDSKLIRLKTLLHDFTRTELAYHCRAIEVLTEASVCVNDFDSSSDLQDFKLKMKDVVSLSEANVWKNSSENLIPYNDTDLEKSPGPGSYHHRTTLGGHDEESSIECTTESSQT